MSCCTNAGATCCSEFNQNSAGCDCTYSTASVGQDATTVLVKQGDDFPFRGFFAGTGIEIDQDNLNPNGITITNIGGGGAVTLQTAYDNGNTIVTAGGLPVDITADTQDALVVQDSGPTGIFSIVNTAPGDADITLFNDSGLQFQNPIGANAPALGDPSAQTLVDAPPSAVDNLSTITIGDIAYTFTPDVPNILTLLRVHFIGLDTLTGDSFNISQTVKYSPLGTVPVSLYSNEVSADPSLGAIAITPTANVGQLDFVLSAGNVADYVVRTYLTIVDYVTSVP